MQTQPITHLCSVEGCGQKSNCRGFCLKHYTRYKRHGDPLIRLSTGKKGINSTHGHQPLSGPSPTYRSWFAMVQRCRNPKNSEFSAYGGRGIQVCDRWEPRKGGSFVNFLADMGPRPEGREPSGRPLYTLDRIDGDGNYEPGNCRWATWEQQYANRTFKRNTHCGRGHLFDEANTYTNPKTGRRSCRTCYRTVYHVRKNIEVEA